MYLLKSWKESLKFLLPSNLKLFFLVTVKAIITTYRLWFFYFWPLILVYMLTEPAFWMHSLTTISFKQISVILLIQHIIYLLIFFTMILAVRSSTKRKTLAYFISYWRHFISWLILGVSMLVIFGSLVCVRQLLKIGLYTSIASGWNLSEFYMAMVIRALIKSVVLFTALATFFTLFYIDTRGTVGDIWVSFLRALRMGKYNYPFCLTLSFVLFALFLIVAFFILLVAIGFVDMQLYAVLAIYKICNLLFLPISISFFTNFYIKRLHDQFKLYVRG